MHKFKIKYETYKKKEFLSIVRNNYYRDHLHDHHHDRVHVRHHALIFVKNKEHSFQFKV